ncbi:hypothetical protein R3W88_033367 [Solanum pinnatisectum]|uniref:Uncharacterized protein n=1 Tax=Solanum pinnatisectum TaxID=50273 RepID=A0AAV9K169_9SOLN|nr:hypothetical protein R3W88_033367 [Solanum pinnatisectum]
MNLGKPSDDLSKIREGSSVMVTLSLFHGLIHVLNAHTGKLTPRSGTWGVAPRNPFFLIHSERYKNGGEVNSTRQYSGMDVNPSGRDNHFGPGRSGNHSQERKRLY